MLGKEKSIDQFSKDGVFLKTWPSISAAAAELGVEASNIWRSLDHPTKRDCGFMWKTSVMQMDTERFPMKYEPSEEQRAEFNRRITRYMPVLYNLIKKYDFINGNNVQDYTQEALVFAWINYNSFTHSVDDGARFGGWFRLVCKWGIFGYYKYTKQWKYTAEFDDRLLDHEEEDITTAYTLALYHCLEKMSQDDQALVKAWMECKDSFEVSERLKLSRNNLFKNMKRIYSVLKDGITYYLHGIQASRIGIYNNEGRHVTAVDQLDLNGQWVRSYASMEAVKEHGFSPSCISSCISRRQGSHKGFLWRPSIYKQVSASVA